MRIRARYRAFGLYETALLGIMAQSTGWATAARECVEAAAPEPVISFGARHVHPDVTDNARLRGDRRRLRRRVDARRRAPRRPRADRHHAPLAGAHLWRHGQAAEAFDRHMPPEVPRIVLVDTFRDEAEESLRVAHALGDRLYGVRLDTPSERGRVTPDLVREVRARLDQAGYGHVKIIVSGGLNAGAHHASSRSTARRSTRTPSARTSPARKPIDFTGDLKEIDGKPIAKRGRIPGLTPSPRLQKLRRSKPGGRSGVTVGSVLKAGQMPWPWQIERRMDRRDQERLAELAERETAYGLFQRAGALLQASPPRPGRGPARARRSARAAQGLDRRGTRRGRTTTAVSTIARRRRFRELLDIDPSAAYGHFGLGQSLKQLGQPDEARIHLRLAVALAPDSSLYRSALSRLARPRQ